MHVFLFDCLLLPRILYSIPTAFTLPLTPVIPFIAAPLPWPLPDDGVYAQPPRESFIDSKLEPSVSPSPPRNQKGTTHSARVVRALCHPLASYPLAHLTFQHLVSLYLSRGLFCLISCFSLSFFFSIVFFFQSTSTKEFKRTILSAEGALRTLPLPPVPAFRAFPEKIVFTDYEAGC